MDNTPHTPLSIAKLLRQPISTAQSRDTGMAMVLLLLIFTYAGGRLGLVPWAIGALVLTMTVPKVYRYVATVWLSASHVLGNVVSKIMLGIVFVAVVTPLGLLRKLLGHDQLKLRAFKAGTDSVMVERNHTYVARDIEMPY